LLMALFSLESAMIAAKSIAQCATHAVQPLAHFVVQRIPKLTVDRNIQ